VFALALMYFPFDCASENELITPITARRWLSIIRRAHDFVGSRLLIAWINARKIIIANFRFGSHPIDVMGFIIFSNCIILSLGPNYMRVLCVVLWQLLFFSARSVFPIEVAALRKHDIALLSWLVSRDLLQRPSSTWPIRLLLLFSPAHRHLISILFE
jgi:hypothetical protein